MVPTSNPIDATTPLARGAVETNAWSKPKNILQGERVELRRVYQIPNHPVRSMTGVSGQYVLARLTRANGCCVGRHSIFLFFIFAINFFCLLPFAPCHANVVVGLLVCCTHRENIRALQLRLYAQSAHVEHREN